MLSQRQANGQVGLATTGRATEAEARAMLGTAARDHVVRLADALAGLDPAALVRTARDLADFAPDYTQLLDELASLLARVALRQSFDGYDAEELYPPELIERLAAAFTPEDLQLFYQTAIVGRRDLPLAPDPRTGFEMTLLRMIAFRPAGAGTSASSPPRAERPRNEAPSRGTRSAAPSALAAALAADEWGAIVASLDLTGFARQLAANCALVGRESGVVRLALDPRNQSLKTPAQQENLAQALSRHFGEKLRVEIDVRPVDALTPAQAEQRVAVEATDAARRAFDADPTVQALKDRFGATVLPDSVRPAR